MKQKLSVTMDLPLVRFLDTQPGRSRSEKIARILRRYREVTEDIALRRALAKRRESPDEHAEREAWGRTMGRAQWSE